METPSHRFAPLAARVLSAIGIVALTAASLMAQPSAEDKDDPRPEAVVVGPIHDFGRLPWGARVEHVFEIRNRGTAPLELSDAASSCGCTVLDYDRSIPPGESGGFRVGVDTSTQAGAFAVHVDVMTNDVERPSLQMTVKADLQFRVVAHPGYVRFVTWDGATPPPRSRQIVAAVDDGPLRIAGVESPYPWVTVEVSPADEAERLAEGGEAQWRLDVRLAPTAPIGPMNGTLLLRLDHPGQDELRIPVHGIVEPVLVVEPSALELGEVMPANGVRGSLRIRNTTPDPIDLVGVSTDVPGLRLILSSPEGSEGRLWYLAFELAESHPPGPVRGLIEIETASERLPLLQVPVVGMVR